MSQSPSKKDSRKAQAARIQNSLASGSSIAPHVNKKRPQNAGTLLDEEKIKVIIKATVQPHYVFGSSVSKIDPICSIAISLNDKEGSDRLIYLSGKQICLFEPESSSQYFLGGKSKSSVNFLHYSFSSNNKFISVCESQHHGDFHDGSGSETEMTDALISVYNVNTLQRHKGLNIPSSLNFVMTCFCGDPRFLLALQHGVNDKQMHLWQWEKEKLVKSVGLPQSVTKIRAAPSGVIFATSSGSRHLKCWFVSPEGSFKSANMLPLSKENENCFIDHVWLPNAQGTYKMIALAESESDSNDNNNTREQKKQTLFIFEGSDMPVGSYPPVSMELRQTIQLKIPPVLTSNGGVPSAPGIIRAHSIGSFPKGFVVVGSHGFVTIYDRTEEKRDPYIEVKRILLGDVNLIGAAVYSSDEKVAVIADSGRILTLSMDIGTITNPSSAIGGQRSTAAHDGASQGLVTAESNHGIGLARGAGALAENLSSGAQDLLQGGFHHQDILSADMSFDRSLVATISSDRSLRIWNYETMKCELVHNFRSDEPLSVAMHSSGFQVLVSFKDRVRLFNVLMDKIRPYRETIAKSCKELRFSHGCQYWAAASGLNALVYDTKTFQQLITFQGHMMSIKRLVWAPGDLALFTTGMDGNCYGWPVSSNGPSRIDVIAANNRASVVSSLVLDTPSLAFNRAKSDDDDDDPSAASNTAAGTTANPQRCFISCMDGTVKVVDWNYGHKASSIANVGDEGAAPLLLEGDPENPITSMCVTADGKFMIAGTNHGTLRIYAWPPESLNKSPSLSNVVAPGSIYSGYLSVYREVVAHSMAVNSIKLSPRGNLIVSTAEDGTVFLHRLVIEDVGFEDANSNNNSNSSGRGNSSSEDDLNFEGTQDFRFNSDVITLSTEDLDEHIHEMAILHKQLADSIASAEYMSHQKELEHADELKKIMDHHGGVLEDERSKYESLRSEFDRRVRELLSTMSNKEMDSVKMTTELENRYEHKLADQLDRYDKLSEEMELLKQKCESLLSAERSEFENQLNGLKMEARNREKKLRSENRRIMDDKVTDENAFKEILDQQEEEYEDELRQLIGAAESELSCERDTVMKLRTLVQTKNTKIDQMKKKLVELSAASKARLTLVNIERQEKQKLIETIEHYKKNLVEREQALSEKEKVIIELRSTTRTLENFRFVLDHRLQQLSAERGPITTHIEGLEKHISTMYEELVEEFDDKKARDEAIELKDQKIALLSNEISNARYEIRQKERYVAAFKRDVENVIMASVFGKELEDAVRKLYKKYVRGESSGLEDAVVKASDAVKARVDKLTKPDLDDIDDISSIGLNDIGAKKMGSKSEKKFIRDVEDALVETAKEADRQRSFKEREANDLKHRLSNTKLETERMIRNRMHDNSSLLFECNDLRKANKDLERELRESKSLLGEAERQLAKLRKEMSSRPSTSPSSRQLRSAPNTGNIISSSFDVPLSRMSTPLLPMADSVDTADLKAIRGEVFDPRFNRPVSRGGVLTITVPPAVAHKPTLPSNQASANEATGNLNRNIGSRSDATLLRHKVSTNPRDFVSESQQLGQSSSQNRAQPHLNHVLSQPGLLSSDNVAAVSGKKSSGSSLAAKNQMHTTEKLSKEVTILAEQLDESQREKDMQRSEISRLRKQLMDLTVGTASKNRGVEVQFEVSGDSEVYGEEFAPNEAIEVSRQALPLKSTAIKISNHIRKK